MQTEEGKYLRKYRIQSTRLPGYDYSRIGLYFVTICTKNREQYFGRIENEEMHLSPSGIHAEQCWKDIPNHFPHVSLDEFIIMPNHVHGIIHIWDDVNTNNNDLIVETQNFVETHNYASLQLNQPYTNKFGPQSKNLSSIIRGFKIGVQKWATINDVRFAWQPRFHDRIIRKDGSLQKIRDYIRANPEKWTEDELFVE